LLKFDDKGEVPIPKPDGTFAVVVVDWVVEHLPEPEQCFGELLRVTKPGGWVCIRTSNLFHYSYAIAALVGTTRLGERLLSWVQPSRKECDVFPKCYRANTGGALRRALLKAGFQKVVIVKWDSEPAYVGNTFIGQLVGFIYHRLALCGVLPRANLLAFAQKA
jgi:ubiquinone/menaquinone biosynthesis C-methylase UbiE